MVVLINTTDMQNHHSYGCSFSPPPATGNMVLHNSTCLIPLKTGDKVYYRKTSYLNSSTSELMYEILGIR